jgi:hypothetical protein
VLACALMLVTLTGCGTFSTVKTRPRIPAVPADLQTCFDPKVKVPGKRGTALTQEQTIRLITALWASDANKTRCGKRLLAFITNLDAKP